MAEHPLVPYDQALIDDIAAAMELRAPNQAALEAVAKTFDGADGDPFEAVCDVATAVGKTYLAGGLIDYLAASGIRHFMIVVPRRPILDKTVNNLTEGHRKSILGGMESHPLVYTAENFNTSAMGAALRSPDRVTVGVFTVQSLIRPKSNKVTMKVTKQQEWLGENLYEFLQGCDDLVVIADESHAYQVKAAAFSAAVRDLDAMATIGLTATPAKSDEPNVVYRYELAQAIADHWVKTPVLVGRKDAAKGTETRLRDGLLLLDAKQKMADRYADTEGKPRVNAVMFVIAGSTDAADQAREVLAKPDLFGDDYDRRVLVVHSKAADDALTRLAAVEDPDSPVRVIVSVDMLKEGWDVANIFVICSLRPMISEMLQEQTLGRGLRLPWKRRTQVELLDTLEVIAHERYKDLLARAGALIPGLTDDRVAEAEITPVPPASTGGAGGDTVKVTAHINPTGTGDSGSGTGAGSEAEFVLTSMDARAAQAAEQADDSTPVEPTVEIRVPLVTRTVAARSFSLSDVDADLFADLGRRLGSSSGETLVRTVLEIEPDPDNPGRVHLVPHPADVDIDAAPPSLPFGNAADALREQILRFDIVDEDRKSVNAAKRLVAAAVEAAGSEEALAAFLPVAIDTARKIINNAYRKSPEVITLDVSDQILAPRRLNTRRLNPNRYGDFAKTDAYSGWAKSQHPINWFDSKPERALALLADADDSGVVIWARIQRGDLTVEWDGGRYSPDLYADTGDDRHWLIEVKADKDMDSPTVQAKKTAAEQWARHVTDNGDHGTWTYVLISQSVAENAPTFAAALQQAGGGR